MKKRGEKGEKLKEKRRELDEKLLEIQKINNKTKVKTIENNRELIKQKGKSNHRGEYKEMLKRSCGRRGKTMKQPAKKGKFF